MPWREGGSPKLRPVDGGGIRGGVRGGVRGGGGWAWAASSPPPLPPHHPANQAVTPPITRSESLHAPPPPAPLLWGPRYGDTVALHGATPTPAGATPTPLAPRPPPLAPPRWLVHALAAVHQSHSVGPGREPGSRGQQEKETAREEGRDGGQMKGGRRRRPFLFSSIRPTVPHSSFN